MYGVPLQLFYHRWRKKMPFAGDVYRLHLNITMYGVGDGTDRLGSKRTGSLLVLSAVPTDVGGDGLLRNPYL
jgi:hypothetical protein